jgi:HD-GYP domain-containing protein (c-di-GMP phosphodiesterase class II)
VHTDVLHSKMLYTVLGLMLATALVPLVFVSWRLISMNRSSLAERQRQAQVQLVEGRARDVSASFARAARQTASLARGLELGGTTDLAAVDTGKLEGALLADENLIALAVVPAEGPSVLVRDAERFPPGSDESLVAAAGAAARERGRQTEGPVTPGPGVPPVFVVAEPVASADRVLGAVVSVVDFARALGDEGAGRDRTETAILGRDEALVYVVGADGVVLADPDPAAVGRASERDAELLGEWAARRDEGAVVVREYEARLDGEPATLLGAVATARMPGGAQLGVVAVANRDLAFAPANRMATQTIVACVFAAFVALLVALLFAWQVATPLSELARGARAIAGGDFGHRLDVRSRNELGQLAGDFNRMAERLEEGMHRMRDTVDTSRALFIGTVRGLAAAIDGKDPYTRGHSERVAEYSAAMAAEMGLGEEEIEKIRIGGLMHDLGKLAIEDKILRKPAALTDEEFEIMREHPERGTRIMAEIPQMREYIPGMRFHHEMVNGKGYPLGLAGDQIPLMARIVCVADTFDAMTTNRPYQKQMPIDVVFEKIRSMEGVRYDPRVVDALVAAYENGRIRLRMQKPPRPGQAAEDDGG